MKIITEWPNVTSVQHFCSGFDQANLVSSFRGSKYFPKIWFSNVYFFEYEHLKRFFKRWQYFRLEAEDWELSTFFADRCLLYMSNDIRIRQHIFFSTISNSIIKHPKHDNCAHLAPSVVLHQSIVVLISGFF